MKTVSSKPSIASDHFDLTELLATNKSLAQQKRRVHQQKLRQYSQKAVKIKQILRSSIDQSQRKCLEGKLRSLEQKQNAQINKLSTIDQIEKEIDEQMHEQNQGNASKPRVDSRHILHQLRNQYTPAKKLIKKPQQNENSDEQSNLQFSVQSKYGFASSQFNVERHPSNQKRKALKMLNENDLHTLGEQDKKPSKESRVYSWWEPSKGSGNNPLIAYTVGQQARITKNIETRWDQNILEQLSKQQQRRRKKIDELEVKAEQLIGRQRVLMQRIDSLQRQQSNLIKKCSTFVNSIHRSKDIILSSGLLLQQLVQMQTFTHLKQKSSHQFSIDSLQSYNQSENTYYGLSVQLSHFEKLLQQFLLSAQRVTMITSGQLQQSSLKANRMKEDCNALEGKKRNLQAEMGRYEQAATVKKKQIKMIQEACNSLNTQMSQLDSISEVKKKLIIQLQQKCEKLKCKKRIVSQKVQKAECDLQRIEQQYQRRAQELKGVEQKTYSWSIKQEEMEKALIFTQRKLQELKKQRKILETQKANGEAKLKDLTISQQRILQQIGEDQKRLVELKSQLAEQTLHSNDIQDRVSKINIQLKESTSVLEDQRTIIASQNQQINDKNNQLLQAQKKIIGVAESMRAIEAQNLKLVETMKKEEEEISELKKEKELTFQAKEELQDILRQIMSKKETLINELELRSEELSTLLTDLMDAHNQLTSKQEQFIAVDNQLQQSLGALKDNQANLQRTKQELEELMEEQQNILGRISRLKQVEQQICLQVGLRGSKGNVEQELKSRIEQAIGDMEMVQSLKCQLKECKYQNRKLRLDNQRLLRLAQVETNNDKHS